MRHVLQRDLAAAVGAVADDGVADVGEVDAELVGAAGFGGEFEEGVAGAGVGAPERIGGVTRVGAFEIIVGAESPAPASTVVAASVVASLISMPFEMALRSASISAALW